MRTEYFKDGGVKFYLTNAVMVIQVGNIKSSKFKQME